MRETSERATEESKNWVIGLALVGVGESGRLAVPNSGDGHHIDETASERGQDFGLQMDLEHVSLKSCHINHLMRPYVQAL